MVIDQCNHRLFYLRKSFSSSSFRYLVLHTLRLRNSIEMNDKIRKITFMVCVGSNSLWVSLNLGLSLINGCSIPVLGRNIPGGN